MVAEAADAIATEPESWRGKSGAALCAPAAALVAFGSQSAGKYRGVFKVTLHFLCSVGHQQRAPDATR